MKIENLQKYEWNHHMDSYSGCWVGRAKLHGEWTELFCPILGYEDEYEVKSFMIRNQITRKAFLPK